MAIILDALSSDAEEIDIKKKDEQLTKKEDEKRKYRKMTRLQVININGEIVDLH